MKKTSLTILRLLRKTFLWKKYEHKHIIIKYFKKTHFKSTKTNFGILLKKWNLARVMFISRQINVCKISGIYKRTFNVIGASRHNLRNNFALSKIPNWKKLSW